jgi:septal ring factor EnvC (AmiA/AmiB activator)
MLVTERLRVQFLERILQFFPRKRKENQLLLVDTEHAELGVKVMAEQVRVEVLEERLANFETLVSRLDSAIEKIAEVNNNVSRMLAVHEERITKQEEIDAVLFAIMTSLLNDYHYWNGNFGLASESWEQL